MGFVEAVKSCFHNYVGFSGRAARSEYWFWILFFVIVVIITSIIDMIIAPNSAVPPLTTIAELAFFLPGLAVVVRRLHDRDKSGWWILLGLIPLVGGIILLVWFCMRGSVGPNRFGPDPLEGRM